MVNLWALGDAGRDALVGVVTLLVGEGAATRVPVAARRAVAGADLLVLRKPGGDDADGLPPLRPIGMPEVLRKLAAAALAGTVRGAAAELLSPLELGVEVSSACERIIHALDSHMAHHPGHAGAQLDFRNAFNQVARVGGTALLNHALPALDHYLEWVYGGEWPCVYGWADPEGGGPPPAPGERGGGGADAAGAARLPLRLWQLAVRGA